MLLVPQEYDADKQLVCGALCVKKLHMKNLNATRLSKNNVLGTVQSHWKELL